MITPKLQVSGVNLKVIKCVKERKSTLEEIWKVYVAHHPRMFIAKRFLPPIAIWKIKNALDWLVSAELVCKEPTNFTDVPLENETIVYWISDEGRAYLHRKK